MSPASGAGWLVLALAVSAPLPALRSAFGAGGRLVTLEEAERSALSRQPQILAARAATQAAQARAGQASAALWPQVNASAGYKRSTGNLTPQPGASAGASVASSLETYNVFSGSLAASQLLVDFGQTSGRVGAARANAQATAQSERAQLSSILFGARSAFFTARAAQALAEVAREALENQQKHRAQTEAFVAAGTRPEIDQAQARADEANAAFALVNAENGARTARQLLNVAMGVAGTIDYTVADDAAPAVSGEELELEPLLAEAEAARPELRALAEQQKAARETLRSIEGQLWPTLSANAAATQGGTSLAELGFNFSIGVGLAWPVYLGGITREEEREARANLAALGAQLEALRLQLRAEVDSARLALSAAKSSIGAAKDVLANARLRLRLAEERYRSGLGNVIEQGDAQLALTSAEAQLVQSEFNLATARALLSRALARP